MANQYTEEQKAVGKKIKRFLKAQPGRSYTRKQIIKRFNNIASKDELNLIIDYLLKSGTAKYTGSNRIQYKPKPKGDVVKQYQGVVDMTSSGTAYVVVEGLEDDVRVDRRDTNHALDGDRVLVGLFPNKKGSRPRGEILEILERNQNFFIGTVELSEDYAFIITDNKNMPVDIFVKKKNINGAKNGDKVVVEFIDWPKKSKNPNGKIIEVLGQSGDHDVEMKSILVENNFPLNFTKGVQRELDNIQTKISDDEIAKRRDIRQVLTFTIDPVDAKDFDDALSFQELEDGTYEIGVHIADVSHYVQPDTELDENGYRRATSVYLVDRVLPMLPEKLSNIVCSLRPHEESLCFSVFFTMNDKAEVLKYHIDKTVIYSDHRFSYEQAFDVIKSGQGEFAKPLGIINSIAEKLRSRRFNEGSINFDSQELRFELGEDGHIMAVHPKQRNEAHFLIEELMLLTNKTVAQFIGKKKLKGQPFPFVYRIHDQPDPEKLQVFANNAAEYGYQLNVTNLQKLPQTLNHFFKEIEGKPEQHSLESLAIRSMAKATYSTDNIGHYGLGFADYTHFTSPIRRYPDIMVHRQIYSYLTTKNTWEPKEELEERCVHSSSMERKAVEAERQSVKYFQTVYLEDKVGEEFPGVVTGVTSWGFYVEISDVYTEGLVRIGDMEKDAYQYDEKRKQIIGAHHGEVFRMGQGVLVRVDRVDVLKRQVDLSYIRMLTEKNNNNG